MTSPAPIRAIDLIRRRQDWRQTLEREYQPTARRLIGAYSRVLPRLQDLERKLIADIEALDESGELTAGRVKGLKTYRDLIDRIEVEMQDFAVIAKDEAARLAADMIKPAVDAALSETTIQVPGFGAELTATFLRPDPAAIERLVGYVDSAAMRAKFAKFGEAAGQDFADKMIAMVAQGKNPRFIARAVAGWNNIPASWAENMTRTTQLYSYRTATHAAYLVNDKLYDGWMWRAALDTRTCMSCISRHGTTYKTTETLTDHHRGRCAPIPVIKGSTWRDDVISGRDWYGKLPPDVQRRISGDLMWTAMQQGDVGWDDISKPYDDDVFGKMLREASVKELVEDGRRYWQLDQLSRGMQPVRTTPEQAAVIAAETRAETT
jgi:hypothetical protein